MVLKGKCLYINRKQQLEENEKNTLGILRSPFKPRGVCEQQSRLSA